MSTQTQKNETTKPTIRVGQIPIETMNELHNKISIVNIARDFHASIAKKESTIIKEIKFLKTDVAAIEQYVSTLQGSELALTIRTDFPTSVSSLNVKSPCTIQKMNETIEKAKRLFGQDLMIQVRNFCLSLVTSSTDHMMDTWVDDGEYYFKFSVPSAKLTIDLVIFS